MSEELRRDVSRKLQSELARVLERELAIATHVLDMPGIAMVLTEAAVMMVRTASATVANSARESNELENIYDAMVAAIVEQVGYSRDNALQRVRAAVEVRAS